MDITGQRGERAPGRLVDELELLLHGASVGLGSLQRDATLDTIRLAHGATARGFIRARISSVRFTEAAALRSRSVVLRPSSTTVDPPRVPLFDAPISLGPSMTPLFGAPMALEQRRVPLGEASLSLRSLSMTPGSDIGGAQTSIDASTRGIDGASTNLIPRIADERSRATSIRPSGTAVNRRA